MKTMKSMKLPSISRWCFQVATWVFKTGSKAITNEMLALERKNEGLLSEVLEL